MKRRNGSAYPTSNSRARRRRALRRACMPCMLAACAGALVWGTAAANPVAASADYPVTSFIVLKDRSADLPAIEAAPVNRGRLYVDLAPRPAARPGAERADYARNLRPRAGAGNERQGKDFAPDHPALRVTQGALPAPPPLALLGREWAELIAERLERAKAPKD